MPRMGRSVAGERGAGGSRGLAGTGGNMRPSPERRKNVCHTVQHTTNTLGGNSRPPLTHQLAVGTATP